MILKIRRKHGDSYFSGEKLDCYYAAFLESDREYNFYEEYKDIRQELIPIEAAIEMIEKEISSGRLTDVELVKLGYTEKRKKELERKKTNLVREHELYKKAVGGDKKAAYMIVSSRDSYEYEELEEIIPTFADAYIENRTQNDKPKGE